MKSLQNSSEEMTVLAYQNNQTIPTELSGETLLFGKKMKRKEIHQIISEAKNIRENHINLFEKDECEMEMDDENEEEMEMDNNDMINMENMNITNTRKSEKDEMKKPMKTTRKTIIDKNLIQKENTSFLIGNTAKLKQLKKFIDEKRMKQNNGKENENGIEVNPLRLMNLKKEFLHWKELNFKLEEELKMIEDN